MAAISALTRRVTKKICYQWTLMAEEFWGFWFSFSLFSFSLFTTWLKPRHTSEKHSSLRWAKAAWGDALPKVFQSSSHRPSSWLPISPFPVCTSLTEWNTKLLRCLSCSPHSRLWFCPVAFQLRYWTRSEREDTASVQRTVGNQTSTSIQGVKGSTAYYISVRAYNTAGTGPPSTTVNVTTKKPRRCCV